MDIQKDIKTNINIIVVAVQPLLHACSGTPIIACRLDG